MINLNNISKNIGNKELFKNLTLALNDKDRLAIIGQNGCGKSTLLKLIAGIESPDSGYVDISNHQINFTQQELDVNNSHTIESFLDVNNFPETWRLMSEVNIIELPLDTQIKKLSGGQRTKLILIKAFSRPSSVVLLDEPSNHLDKQGMNWLEKQINRYDGIVIFISHDRKLINKCAEKILEIDTLNKRTTLYNGSYEQYLEERSTWLKEQAEAYKIQEKKRKDMTNWLVLKRQEATVYANPSAGRKIRQMEKRMEREIFSQEISKPKVSKNISDNKFSGEVHKNKLIVRLKDINKSYKDELILKDISIEVRGNSRVKISGENGSGKSTLLKIINRETEADSGVVEIGDNISIGYFSQHLDILKSGQTVREAFIANTEGLTESRARSILGAFLFTGDDIYKKIENISYGEKVRLNMSILLQKRHELLILDEPTNHLDIPSMEVIENALIDFAGAIIVVSHDEYFLEKIGIDQEIRL